MSEVFVSANRSNQLNNVVGLNCETFDDAIKWEIRTYKIQQTGGERQGGRCESLKTKETWSGEGRGGGVGTYILTYKNLCGINIRFT